MKENLLEDIEHISKGMPNVKAMGMEKVVALAGNPNTGKSTVFNSLTGLNQHTGNWPGKTVLQARGYFQEGGYKFTLIDLPGIYSLLSPSAEEEVARDFLCFAKPHITVVVVDATSLERNLNLVLQVMEITPRVVVCLNLIDEAKRKKIYIDSPTLSRELGVPVIPTIARNGEGLVALKDTILKIFLGAVRPKPRAISYSEEIEGLVKKMLPSLEDVLKGQLNPRWVALRLLEGDHSLIKAIYDYLSPSIEEPEVKPKHELKASTI